MNKSCLNNLAVFDLDGTLWFENSHVYLVENYYRIYGMKKFFMKVFGRIFPKKNMKLLSELFDRIPNEYIQSFSPTYNLDIINKMMEYKKNNWDVIIITNAPNKIVSLAKDIFKVEVRQAKISYKCNALSDISFNLLNVITDNITDMDLISKADKAVVLLDEKNKKYFTKIKLGKIKLIYKDKCLKGKKFDV